MRTPEGNIIEHFVQFYEDDAYLLGKVASFIRAGLSAGEVAIVCVTPAHRLGLEQRLRADIARAAASHPDRELYVVLDAHDTLQTIMVNGQVDDRLFIQNVEPLLKRLSKNGSGRVRIFGEMVVLLSAEGQHDAAVRLEACWNDLAAVYPMSIFCGYPMNVFARESDGDAFLNICNVHARVVPAESYTAPAGAHEHYRAIALLQQKAAALGTEMAHRKELEKILCRRENELAG